MENLIVVLILIAWLAVAVYTTGLMARWRGRSVAKWRLLGMWFFPFTLLILVAMDTLYDEES